MQCAYLLAAATNSYGCGMPSIKLHRESLLIAVDWLEPTVRLSDFKSGYKDKHAAFIAIGGTPWRRRSQQKTHLYVWIRQNFKSNRLDQWYGSGLLFEGAQRTLKRSFLSFGFSFSCLSRKTNQLHEAEFYLTLKLLMSYIYIYIYIYIWNAYSWCF